MKTLSDYIEIKEIKEISEGLKIGAKSKVNVKSYKPKNKQELKDIIKTLLDERGYNADLTDIDTSEITDMSHLFDNGKFLNFDGNISNWDVSNVTNMKDMFADSDFTGNNGDISGWDVSNVENMEEMFWRCKNLSIDINNWDVSKVTNMKNMFMYTPFKSRPDWYKK